VHATMAIKTMFGALKDNPDYTSIINDRHFGRLRSWIEEARQKGAKVIELNPAAEDLSDPTLRRIAPTLILYATEKMTVLKEEIFGPILPVLTYDSIDDAIAYVRNHPHPLTLYYFGQDEAEERLVLDQTVSGGDGQRLHDSRLSEKPTVWRNRSLRNGRVWRESRFPHLQPCTFYLPPRQIVGS